MDWNSPVILHVNLSVLAMSLICLVPLGLWFASIRLKMKAYRQQRRYPFDGLSRRPAGESLRIKIRELDDQLNDRITLLVCVPTLTAANLYLLPSVTPLLMSFFAIISVAWTYYFGGRVNKTLEDRRNYQLGFDGERFVAEELNRLIPLGFEVFHDVPFEGFNIDHVLVGRSGIFTVETKARRKPVSENGVKKWEVLFDGKALIWPHYSSTREIVQARRNAESISKWLSKAIGRPVVSTPILALPGWWVNRQVPPNGLFVVNPVEISKLCEDFEVTLDEDISDQVCYQLEQRCSLKSN